MKKFFTLLLSLFVTSMIISPVLNVIAEERAEDDDQNDFIIKVSADGQYISHIYEDEIILFDLEGNIVATATYTTIEIPEAVIPVQDIMPYEIISPFSVDDFEKWGNWVQTEFVQFVPHFNTAAITASALSALMQNAFSIKNIVISISAIGLLCDFIADSITNGQTVTVKGEFSYNVYCNILRKERVNQYNTNGSVKTYGQITTNWLSSPWDYGTADASCRVLAERY